METGINEMSGVNPHMLRTNMTLNFKRHSLAGFDCSSKNEESSPKSRQCTFAF